MELFWYFVIYSFLGFLLEVVFARLTRANKRDRKCFALLPLCPVYGLGALAILLLPEGVRQSGLLLVVFGGLAATGAELLIAVFYEKALGVAFWDYSGLRFNLHGRVCPLFSLFWGLLAALLVHRIHPVTALWAGEIPEAITVSVMLWMVADSIYTAVLLRAKGDTKCLRWYDPEQKNTAG